MKNNISTIEIYLLDYLIGINNQVDTHRRFPRVSPCTKNHVTAMSKKNDFFVLTG